MMSFFVAFLFFLGCTDAAPDGLRTNAACNANFGDKWSTPAQTCPETAPVCNSGVCGFPAPATYSAVDPDAVHCQELLVPGSTAGFNFWNAQGYKVGVPVLRRLTVHQLPYTNCC